MTRVALNNGWYFTEQWSDEFMEQGGCEVRLPHTCRELAFNCLDERDYEMVCGYRRTVFAESEWRGKHVLLTFDGAAHIADVYVNGMPVGHHEGGYTAFTVDISGALEYGADNVIAVRLDTRESCDVPPFGGVIDYLTYGGLYREARIEIHEPAYIADAFVFSEQNRGKYTVKARLALSGDISGKSVRARFTAPDGSLLCDNEYAVSDIAVEFDVPECITSFAGSVTTCEIEIPLDAPVLWDINTPALYNAVFTLGEDERPVRFAVREAVFKKDGFYLNGRKLKLRGLNRHQSFAYVGYAMPASLQRLDADILKYELGLNYVRTSHYPQSHHFVDRCDEIGLLVFTEIPGWQHIGGKHWQDVAVRHCEEMVAQWRNHPSIFLWGVRINESLDNDELYRRTNDRARALDPSRQTSGVRYLEGSSLLEDVYARNDFSCSSSGMRGLKTKKESVKKRSSMKRGYFVTEYCGHMFPTKPYDDEAHRLEHALRHARVLDAMYADPEIAGSSGWCMFDYNTHRDFGSGDRICYHGVTDMFRNKKLAAAVYASGSDGAPVCEVSTDMQIGEHPAGKLGDIYVFTNADLVRVYKNDALIGDFTAKYSPFRNLPHPPIVIDDLVGKLLEQEGWDSRKTEAVHKCLLSVAKYGIDDLPLGAKLRLAANLSKWHIGMDEARLLYGKYIGNWGESAPIYRFDVVKDGEVVASRTCGPAAKVFLKANASSVTLHEGETYDAALVRIEAVDEHGSRRTYFSEPVTLKTEGGISVIGPEVISLKGGCFGTYVKTTGEDGAGTLTLECAGLDPVRIEFTVTKD